MSTIDVTDNPALHRYEARVDGDLAGFAAYRFRGEHQIVFTHTEIEDAFGGQGVGGALAKGALDDVRAKGERKVVALCPFIAAWLERHPAYRALVAA